MTIIAQHIDAKARPPCSVRLIDRRTGHVHRIDGHGPALREARIESLSTRQ